MEYNELITSSGVNLKNIYRYSNCKFINPESTAEHTIIMQLIAVELFQRINPNELDFKELVTRILLHDLDECVLCDLPRDIKYYDEDIRLKINNIAYELLEESGFKKDFIQAIEDSKHSCAEGELVGYLDVLQAIMKMYEEYRLQLSPQLGYKLGDSLELIGIKFNEFKFINMKDTPTLYQLLYKLNKSLYTSIKLGE